MGLHDIVVQVVEHGKEDVVCCLLLDQDGEAVLRVEQLPRGLAHPEHGEGEEAGVGQTARLQKNAEPLWMGRLMEKASWA